MPDFMSEFVNLVLLFLNFINVYLVNHFKLFNHQLLFNIILDMLILQQ